MGDRLENALDQGCRELELGLPANAQTKLLHYLHLLAKWNKSFNLSGVTDIRQMVPLHLLDSLAVVPHLARLSSSLESPTRVLDIGSGAGLPGIPLAIAFPDTRFVLLDSNGKKTRFLFQAKIALQLENLEIVNARVDDYLRADSSLVGSSENPFKGPLESPLESPLQDQGKTNALSIGLVTCRAFATLKDIVTMTAPLLDSGTKLLAMKGVYPHDEIAELPSSLAIEEVIELRVPEIDSQRHLVLLSKSGQQETGA